MEYTSKEHHKPEVTTLYLVTQLQHGVKRRTYCLSSHKDSFVYHSHSVQQLDDSYCRLCPLNDDAAQGRHAGLSQHSSLSCDTGAVACACLAAHEQEPRAASEVRGSHYDARHAKDVFLALFSLMPGADVAPLSELVMMQSIQECDHALIVHHTGGQNHERRHGNDDNTSALELAHEPVRAALPC